MIGRKCRLKEPEQSLMEVSLGLAGLLPPPSHSLETRGPGLTWSQDLHDDYYVTICYQCNTGV